jgi:hypothetical protein
VDKIGKDNQEVGEIGRAINQVPTLRLKDDKIQAQWASSIMLESMLERV